MLKCMDLILEHFRSCEFLEPGIDQGCDNSKHTPGCAYSPTAASGEDVTQFLVEQAIAPIGCDDPTELTPDLIFNPDLEFVPGEVSFIGIFVFIILRK